jgi:hypothetical protein
VRILKYHAEGYPTVDERVDPSGNFKVKIAGDENTVKRSV